MTDIKINILGTEYSVEFKPTIADKRLSDCDGYCDKTSHRIVIAEEGEDCELEYFNLYQQKVVRHEIIHAFLFESGLHENFEHPKYGHEETIVDWIASQGPKIIQAWMEVGAL